MLDHTPIVIDKFMGLFDRGEADACPNDHFVDCLNVYFKESAVARRPKFEDTAVSQVNIKRVRYWQKVGESPRAIVLCNDGGSPSTATIYDASVSLVTPIATFSNTDIDDFQLASMFNRAYLIFQEAGVASDSRHMWVYDGTDFRKAAGNAPGSGMALVESATPGNVSAGTHSLAFSFETPSGFITKPSIITSFTATGGFSLDISSVDVGPSGTVRRHILATRAYNFDLEPTPEFFFVATIEGNAVTTATIDYNDLELSDSADYLFDELEEIQSGMFITKYRNRLVIGGERTNKSYVRFSKVGEPEAFDTVEGYMSIDPDQGGTVYNGIEYRGQFLMFKDPGVFSTVDNASEPVFWEITKLDSGVGTGPEGISTVIDSKGTTNDTFVIATRNGIMLFNGIFNQPELSWKISGFWSSRLDQSKFRKTSVVNDPVLKRIYVGVVLSGSNEINYIIVGDYSLGLDPTNIRWTLWSLGVSLYSIILDTGSSGNPVFKVATTDIVKQATGSYAGTEGTTGTGPFAQTAYLTPIENGSVCHFAGVRYRISGSGAFTTNLFGLDLSNTTSLSNITLATSPTKEILRWCNFINEKTSILFAQNSIDTGDFLVRKLELFAKPLWATRFNE